MFEVMAIGIVAVLIQRIAHNRKVRKILTENDSQHGIM